MKFLKNLFSKLNTEKNLDLDTVGDDMLLVIAKEYIEALGGKENIKNIYSCSTRLRVCLKENKIEKDKLIEKGAKKIIDLDDFNYQIVIGEKAIKLEENINRYLR